jgi:hypothetical protein
VIARWLTWLAKAWLAHVARVDVRRLKARAYPDGTRVRLTCSCRGYGSDGHRGVWVTEYKVESDDYRLTREGDGETTYAALNAIEVVSPPQQHGAA